MDNERGLEGITEEEKIAIRLHRSAGDVDVAGLAEEVGAVAAHGETVGILVDVGHDVVERAEAIYDFVVEAGFEDTSVGVGKERAAFFGYAGL